MLRSYRINIGELGETVKSISNSDVVTAAGTVFFAETQNGVDGTPNPAGSPMGRSGIYDTSIWMYSGAKHYIISTNVATSYVTPVNDGTAGYAPIFYTYRGSWFLNSAHGVKGGVGKHNMLMHDGHSEFMSRPEILDKNRLILTYNK